MKTSHIVYLGLGSNMCDAEQVLASACQAIATIEGLSIEAISPTYFTEPQGYRNQNWFYNLVIKTIVDDIWNPITLMERLLVEERNLGRVRSTSPLLRFGPRKIDIDMLLFDDIISTDEICILPHPRLIQRAFCLIPLRDIAPDITINKRHIDDIVNNIHFHLDGNKIFQSL